MPPNSVTFVRFDQFFDRSHVIARVDKHQHTVLGRTGAAGRSIGRRNMKKIGPTGEASRSGEYPKARRGDLKRLYLFGLDEEGESVVVGPLLLGTGKRKTDTLIGAKTTPELLAKGGTIIRRHGPAKKLDAETKRRINEARRAARRPGRRKPRRKQYRRRQDVEVIRIEPRPYPDLTMDRTIPVMAEIIKQTPV